MSAEVEKGRLLSMPCKG